MNMANDNHVNTKNRGYVEWVNIDEIVPNPLNPRKDDSLNTEILQSIIKNMGWQTPITCYKKGKIYVVLSGHRRLFAARKASIKQIPVFVVDAPSSHQREIEMIANAQLAQEDWSPLEWGKFCYERWIAWGKPPVNTFAKEIRLKKSTVQTYIQVLDYFPMEEIESGLVQRTLGMRTLYDLFYWLARLKQKFPGIVESLTEEMIRRLLVEKLANKKMSAESLRKRDFLDRVREKDIRDFLLDKTASIEDLMVQYEFDIKEKTFHSQLVSMGYARKSVKNLNPKNLHEAKKALDTLKEIQDSLKSQLDYINKKYPNATKKDELFDWE